MAKAKVDTCKRGASQVVDGALAADVTRCSGAAVGEAIGAQLEVLRPRDVSRLLGISETTIWRMRGRNGFPAPIRLSPGRVGYLRSSIAAWVAARAGVSP